MDHRILLSRTLYLILGFCAGFSFIPSIRMPALLANWKDYGMLGVFSLLSPAVVISVCILIVLNWVRKKPGREKNLDLAIIGASIGVIAFLAIALYAILQVMESMLWSGEF